MKQEKTVKKSRPLLSLFQLLAVLSSLAMLYFLYQAQILPIRLFGFIAIFYFLLVSLLIIISRKIILLIILLILDILLNLALVFVFYKYNGYLSQISKNETYQEKYSLLTLAASPLVETGQGEIVRIGILSSDPYKETVEQYLQADASSRKGLLAKSLAPSDYLGFADTLSLTSALLNQTNASEASSVRTIFLSNGNLESLKDNNQEIWNKLHVLQEVSLNVTPKTIETTKNTSLDSPFTVYISGIDNRDHTLPYAARSDVNLILVFNPARHQILVLNTPRDYYVPLAMNGQNDKLTHAGLYGVNESIYTLEKFYNIKINYYARINFDGTSSIIDQLGGVDITLPYAINTYHGHRSYSPGTYHLNGAEALDIARERVSISWAGGDRERGRNQEKILAALISKSQHDPNILGKVDQIFASIAKNIQTNFTSDDLKYLVQKQLTSPAKWQTELIDVDGKADITSTFTYQEPKHFVWHPYPESVDRAKAKLQEYLK